MTASIDDEGRFKIGTTRRAVVQSGLPADALGYDTSDMHACALAMADAAISGRNAAAVAAEIAAVGRRLGLEATDILAGEH